MVTVSQKQPLVTAPRQSLHTHTCTHTNTRGAGAWAGEISAHQREPHWPACCCFKAPINFPLISVYRWKREGSDFKCLLKATKGENIRGPQYRHFTATATHNEWLQWHSWKVPSKGGSFLRWLTWHLPHIVMLYLKSVQNSTALCLSLYFILNQSNSISSKLWSYTNNTCPPETTFFLFFFF